jgi:predicted RNase H-like HicB family nuclease
MRKEYDFSKGVRGKYAKRYKEGTNMNSKYEIIIYWSKDDEAFIAEVPELAGCMSDGKTYQEALTNVQGVIEEWIETAEDIGREIPVPKGRLKYA